MGTPANKTRIVCTIGPASESQGVMEKMLLAGMRSHGSIFPLGILRVTGR
jgi:pyruvate kinase